MSHHLTTQRLLALLSLVCALACMLSLSACSSQTSEGVTPSPSASSSDSFAITATEGIENPDLPERPAEMDNYDEDGAIAAAEYFLRLSLYGVATDNWEDYDAMSAPNCEFCTSYRNDNHKNWSNLSSSTMANMTLDDAVAGSVEGNPGRWNVHLVATRYAHTIVDTDNKIRNIEGETTALAFLIDSSNGWQILKVEIFEPELFYELYPEG